MSDSLPGCYAKLAPHEGESFAGYLLRLAQANQYAGIAKFLNATLGISSVKLARDIGHAMLVLRGSPPMLEALGRVAVSDGRAMDAFAVHILPDGAFVLHGCRVEEDAWLGSWCQYCPDCLRERASAEEAWDIAPVVACPVHHKRLVADCGHCGQHLDWSRSSLFHCGKCGSDLRHVSSEISDPATERASGDFSALARFRFESAPGVQNVGSWELAFKVVKALTLVASDFLDQEWPHAKFKLLPELERYQAVLRFAGASEPGLYKPRALREHIAGELHPLDAIPRSGVKARRAFKMLHSAAGMPRWLSGALTADELEKPQTPGAHVFGGRPPRLMSSEDVEAYLGIDGATLAQLFRLQFLRHPHGIEYRFDIDDVLAAQRFVGEELLAIHEIEQVLQIPIDVEDFARSTLLPAWNPNAALDFRVKVGAIADLQLRLAGACARATPPHTPITAGQWARSRERPFQSLCAIVAAVIQGEITMMEWRRPFTWAALVVDLAEAGKVIRDFKEKLP